jgi:hypothetical protein
MALHSDYINTIEMRLSWLKWATGGRGREAWTQLGFGPAMPAYEYVLEHADTFYMAPHFCRLVEHARLDVPGDLVFDSKWLNAKCGWMWLSSSFEVPFVKETRSMPYAYSDNLEDLQREKFRERIRVRAVGWRLLEPGTIIQQGTRRREDGVALPSDDKSVMRPAEPGSVQFCTFQDFKEFNPTSGSGFGCWSYFVVHDGQRLADRVIDFEERQTLGRYHIECPNDHPDITPDRRDQPLHEIRWIYAAIYLMAQRLATTVTHETDRATRRRAERNNQEAPPFIRVITLRRLEQAREREAPTTVDWQWQWEVRGHWRNQFYPSEGVHKPKFIEAYIKGPEDKPLKPGVLKLFTAER